MAFDDRIINVNIEEEMRSSYIDYSMSVIVARALPDVRDGFKPVHRRILYGMDQIGNTHDKPTKKSARIVGEVLGKYHPHGDSSVYGALVRMAQDWNMRYTLVDGQGNFGSMDGDSAAAMRYTEARLSLLGEAMMQDIEKETVDMQNNFDDTLTEPTVMPTRIPNLLVNGASGIAVGMATNIPTHNLSEVIDGCVAYIDNPEIDVEGLMHYVKAPDFPTGAYIMGMQGVRDAYETGRGRIIIRAKTEIETTQTHDKIIVTEIPYGVNKAELIRHIAQLVGEKKLDGISNVNDESDREGLRIVVDVKRDANTGVVLNKLFKMTALQTSFSVNCIALVHGRPKLLTLRDCISNFVEHRHEVTIRRTQFDLRKAQERAHILDALIIASDNIDEVVHTIRASRTPAEAQERLMKRFSFDEVQAKAIVDMRLAQLTGLQQEKLHQEYEELTKRIAFYNSILNDDSVCRQVMKDDLLEVKEKYGDARRTEIQLSAEEFNPEDFYADDEMVITLSHLGYIKRTPLSEYRHQARGGMGSRASSSRDGDFIEHLYHATMHNTMLFFTSRGRCYWLKVYDIPEGNKTSKGRAIQNLLQIEAGDSVSACLQIRKLNDPEFCMSHYVCFATSMGLVKKTCLSHYARPRANGIQAINIRPEDSVVSVILTNGENELVLANRNGRAIRFNEDRVRPMGRVSTGVRAIRLDEDGQDAVVGMIAINHPERETIFIVSENGYGKRSSVEDYRVTGRGGKGVRTLKVTEKTGKVVAIHVVIDEIDLMIINTSGIALRMHVDQIRPTGRNTQGVRVINLEKRGDTISRVCPVGREEDEEPVDASADTTSEPAATEEAQQPQEVTTAENAEATPANPTEDNPENSTATDEGEPTLF